MELVLSLNHLVQKSSLAPEGVNYRELATDIVRMAGACGLAARLTFDLTIKCYVNLSKLKMIIQIMNM